MSETAPMAKAVAVADQAVPMVEVTAPSDLPEGYVFEAVANGESFQVTVPAGGVKDGQSFRAPFIAGGGGAAGSSPMGRWKDGLCGCCAFGCCHPALWMACCCRLALLGQVQNRLRLNWLGQRANPGDYSPFKILLGFSIATIAISIAFSSMMQAYRDPITMEALPGYWPIYTVYQVFSFLVLVFAVYVVLKTRQVIRARNEIPEKSCVGCEDCCCAFWCGCCAVAQMARHTAEYETYIAQCCSETGLPANAPQLGGVESEIV